MAKSFTPNTPYNVPFFLLQPTYKKVKGVKQKTFVKNNTIFYCSFKTFGGTEKIINDVLCVEDTGTLETWFDPIIKADCQIEIDGKKYEILGTPENINLQNQYMTFKVRAVKGGA